MSISVATLDAVTEATLQALVEGGARESTTLEFKRDAYGGNDDARAEFLADIAAFANTAGGDLIIGMDEVDATASDVVGLAADADAEVLRLQQMATAGIQPQLPALGFKVIPLASGRHAIVLRVGRSYNPPHRVVFKNRNRFWLRGPAARFEPDVDGLRTLFNAGPAVAERIREFRAERLGAVLGDETPVPLQQYAGRLILHIVPYGSMEGDIGRFDLSGIRTEIPIMWTAAQSSLSSDMTLDGFVTYTPQTADGCRAYLQVFRSGAMEVVFTGVLHEKNGAKTLDAHRLVRHFTIHLETFVTLLRRRGALGPCAFMSTLTGVKGSRIMIGGSHLFEPDYSLPLPRDVIRLHDIIVPESVSLDGATIRAALRPLLDQLGQAGGAPGALPQWLNVS